MNRRWSKEKINKWYSDLPYLAGANFVPSTASNQLEMWQKETFDPETIKRELGWARDLGMNLMRVFLHDKLYAHDKEGFFQRIDRYLTISDELGIKTSFVFFDDCWNQDSNPGPQPEPKPYTHNSRWVQSPGVKITNDPDKWASLETYVKDVMSRFKEDSRILYWDMYNEPGNGESGDAGLGGRIQGSRSLPLLKQAFQWARSVEGLTQPITAGCWAFNPFFRKLNKFSLENSDLISFHGYLNGRKLARRIARFKGQERPIICTEYMGRPYSTFEKALPVLKEHNVGAINWGLVAGRSHTIYPWGWSDKKGEPDPCFHDILWPDGRMLYEEERKIITDILL